MADAPKYADATREEVEASQMISSAIAAFLMLAGKRSVQWIEEGRQTFAPEHWLMMITLHCIEQVRVGVGGKLTDDYCDMVRGIVDAAQKGVPLLVVNKTEATHKAPGRVQ